MWLSREAFAAMRETFERTLAVVREENATLRRMLEKEAAHADRLLTEITKSLAVQAPTPVAHAGTPARPPARTSRDPIEGLGNVLEPVGFEDEHATFTSERAASLMAAEDEDDDGVSDAA